MKDQLMAIDIGTSGCRVTIFDLQGVVCASQSMEYDADIPYPGYHEQSAQRWWTAACDCLAAIRSRGFDFTRVACIGVDGISWAGLPMSREGKDLYPALTWMDRRAVAQALDMTRRVEEQEIVSLCGNPVDPAYITPKMLWFRDKHPDIYKNAKYFLQCNAYIVLKLTGEFSQDYSQGYGFHFFDMKNGTFDALKAQQLGVDADKVAPLYHCHEVVGQVLQSVADLTGIPAGTPVVAGGLDAACCSLGAGVLSVGQTQEQGGQAGGMSINMDHPLIHPKLILGYHVVPDMWLLQGGSVGGGGALRWFNKQFGAYEELLAKQTGKSSYAIMDEEAAGVAPGSNGLIFLPYMAGERSPLWDSEARGAFIGLSYDKSRAHLIRAVMEGVAYSLRHNLDTAAQVGANVSALNSVGGSANSAVWTQLKSDVTGLPIHVPYSDNSTALGAALLAGIGCGIYSSFKEAVDTTVKISRTYEPNVGRHRIYSEYYAEYLELYPAMKNQIRRMNHIAMEGFV